MGLSNEKTIKWALAATVVFGLIFAMYMLKMVSVLKMFLVLTCVALIGSILLQAGKGGGLAAIGGLQDQSTFGTRTSTFLSKLTYLIGAAFIIGTICLTKISSITFVEKAAVEQTAEMPAGHPPMELPPGHPPTEGPPPGHPPIEGMPPGHPPIGAPSAAAPAEEKPASAALGWQEQPEEKKPEKQEPKAAEQQEAPK